MKIFKYILPIASIFFFGACDTNDDGFYNRVYVDVENLVTIETQPSYSVDDILWVDAYIPRLLQEDGQTELVDIRQTTGNATAFQFSFVLERSNGGNWEPVDVTGDFVEDEGDGLAGSFVEAEAQFNNDLDAYIFRGGIQLSQAGEYRLSYGYNSSSVDVVELISNSTNNNIFVNIYSQTNQVNDEGYYVFTVN